ncbi:hypothetical protein CDAR_40181 [Caerostris darwini]|uniref:Uncharacterized protein n=1 Tax=Caerostris darwini TaxID=1538125 RepID=A0AAV4RAW5_9ARAC|nr:hypothetical protein CDAR_40181 [Caerostris darwini]
MRNPLPSHVKCVEEDITSCEESAHFGIKACFPLPDFSLEEGRWDLGFYHHKEPNGKHISILGPKEVASNFGGFPATLGEIWSPPFKMSNFGEFLGIGITFAASRNWVLGLAINASAR